MFAALQSGVIYYYSISREWEWKKKTHCGLLSGKVTNVATPSGVQSVVYKSHSHDNDNDDDTDDDFRRGTNSTEIGSWILICSGATVMEWTCNGVGSYVYTATLVANTTSVRQHAFTRLHSTQAYTFDTIAHNVRSQIDRSQFCLPHLHRTDNNE